MEISQVEGEIEIQIILGILFDFVLRKFGMILRVIEMKGGEKE